MSYAIRHKTRSARVTITTPDGESVVIENMNGDDGFAVEFTATRTMDDSLGELSVVLYNLSPDVLGLLEACQARRPDDPDRQLAGLVLQTSGVPADGSAATAAGWAQVEVEAGYDGNVSRVYKAIGARVDSERVDDDLTLRTTITAVENLDGVLLGLPLRTFPRGSMTFELADYLRSIAGLGPGNLSQETLAALCGFSVLSAPHHVSGGMALDHLASVFKFLPLRWFVDDREVWVCGREGVPNATGFPSFLPGEPPVTLTLSTRPKRLEGGEVEAVAWLEPAARPGRLVVLTPGGMGLEGLAPSEAEVLRAQVPPGLYRVETAAHAGETDPAGPWDTRLRLRSVATA